MSLEAFEIEAYSVAHGHSATGPITRITVEGQGEVSGQDTWAQLLFHPSAAGLSGTVDNVGVGGATLQIFADLPYDDFARMYNILRNEAPVRLWCEYGASATTSKPLNYIGITSNSKEKPGEGPADIDSVQRFIHFAIKSQPQSESTAKQPGD